MNHCEEYVRVTSREIDSKGLSTCVIFLLKGQNGECNISNVRRFLCGVSPDVPASSVLLFFSDYKFQISNLISLADILKFCLPFDFSLCLESTTFDVTSRRASLYLI